MGLYNFVTKFEKLTVTLDSIVVFLLFPLYQRRPNQQAQLVPLLNSSLPTHSTCLHGWLAADQMCVIQKLSCSSSILRSPEVYGREKYSTIYSVYRGPLGTPKKKQKTK